MALLYLENRLALQRIGCLHMTKMLHRVGAASERFPEGSCCQIADPVSDATLVAACGKRRFGVTYPRGGPYFASGSTV